MNEDTLIVVRRLRTGEIDDRGRLLRYMTIGPGNESKKFTTKRKALYYAALRRTHTLEELTYS